MIHFITLPALINPSIIDDCFEVALLPKNVFSLTRTPPFTTAAVDIWQ
jgi:hypothetical protein